MSDERDVQEVMARYVRSSDRGDGRAMAALFMPDGCVEIFRNQEGEPVPIGKLEGTVRIGDALSGTSPRRPDAWRHAATHDAIVSLHGDKATIDVGFIVYGSGSSATGCLTEAANGAPAGIVAIDAGVYHANLKRHGEGWRISALRITHG